MLSVCQVVINLKNIGVVVVIQENLGNLQKVELRNVWESEAVEIRDGLKSGQFDVEASVSQRNVLRNWTFR